jgi:hypothetical protein
VSRDGGSPDDLPRIGVFCTTVGGEDLDFALRSIELNTEYPDFVVMMAAEPVAGLADPLPQLQALASRYPWFRYVYHGDRPEDRRQLNSPSDMLHDLHQRLEDLGCTRFFQINDDIAVTRWWLHYAESAMRALDGVGVVIPHDGIASHSADAGFSGFYYFSQEYVDAYHPWGAAFHPEPVQCYWVDTEMCVRAAHHGRLRREPMCGVMHLHHQRLPATLRRAVRPRPSTDRPVADGRLFIERMRAERIDPWVIIPDLESKTPGPLLDELRSLRGIGAAA